MVYKKSVKVLVVDDERIIRDFLIRLLSLEGLVVRAAESGKKAIEMAKKEEFDIFFLDVRLPGVDGVQTFRELKKISPESKYVMMTGYSLDGLLKAIEGEKIEAFITKPFEIKEIIVILEDFIREKYPDDIINILIVESDEPVSNFFSKLLQDYNVMISETGEGALKLVTERNFDLILSDISLRDMSGVELYSKIRDIKPEARIILLTGDIKKTEGIIKQSLYHQIKSILK
ncbi:MAG: response regulator [Candidatus Omnitrophota bacterium]|jgi:CheY-like chemotaxis protein